MPIYPGNPVIVSSPQFRYDIEGLRGIAVLIVVAFHCGLPGFSGGFVGVDIFFVLSGYLITGLLEGEIAKNSRLDLVRFYARRVRRLLPASALVALTTLLFSALLLSPEEVASVSKAALANTLYVSNLYFSRAAADYFAADTATNPLLHTWSLGVEEQFYFFWPLLIMAGLQYARSRKILLALLGAVTVASFGLCVWITANNGVFAFYQIPARAWEFGLGGLAALLFRSIPQRTATAMAWAGLAVIAACTVFLRGGAGFPGWIALIPTVATACILVSGTGLARILKLAPLQFLGKLSYSWYLWHWPFLVFAAAAYPEIGIAGRVSAASLALGLAYLAYHFVENPLRFHPSMTSSAARSFGLAALLMAVCALASVTSSRFAASLAAALSMVKVREVRDAYWRLPRAKCIATGGTAEIKSCEFGDAASPTRIVLFGDSHAFQWIHALKEISEARGWRLTTFAKSGCPAADVRPREHDAGFAEACAQWRRESIRRILAARPAIVLVASSAGYLKRTKGAANHNHAEAIPLDEWSEGTRRTLQQFTGFGLRVVQLRDNPRPPFHVPSCVARSVRQPWLTDCSMLRSDVLDAVTFEAEQSASLGLRDLQFVDLTEQYCQGPRCGAVLNGDIVYSDDNHLSPKFIQRMKPLLEESLAVKGLRKNLEKSNPVAVD